VQQIRASHPDLRIIYLTLLRGTRYVHKLSKYNIQGYVLKNASLDELLGALRSVQDGGNLFQQRHPYR
jgi:two-component system response regulator NreC